ATNLRLVALCTMPLACESTISTIISTAAWKRPGTPEVALRAAFQRKKQVTTPSRMAQNSESQLKTEKSTTFFGGWFCRNVRWWTMYSPAVGPVPDGAAMFLSARFRLGPRRERQGQPVHLHREDQAHQQRRPAQSRHQSRRHRQHGERQGNLDHLPQQEPDCRRP